VSITSSSPPFTSTTHLGERFERAVVYALRLHADQRRKETGVPYAAHLLGVCALALEFGATESEAIAALLHDAVEDCGGIPQLESIRERFGDDVAEIVLGCSDSFETDSKAEKEPWYDRKAAYIERLCARGGENDSTLLISACDKLYNVLATYNDVRRTGQSAFERFTAKKYGTLWYYRALADAFASIPGRHAEIALRLADLVDQLAGKAVCTGELLAALTIDSSVPEREKGTLVDRPTTA
jgi:GTP pyrophosphokinase